MVIFHSYVSLPEGRGFQKWGVLSKQWVSILEWMNFWMIWGSPIYWASLHENNKSVRRGRTSVSHQGNLRIQNTLSYKVVSIVYRKGSSKPITSLIANYYSNLLTIIDYRFTLLIINSSKLLLVSMGYSNS